MVSPGVPVERLWADWDDSRLNGKGVITYGSHTGRHPRFGFLAFNTDKHFARFPRPLLSLSKDAPKNNILHTHL